MCGFLKSSQLFIHQLFFAVKTSLYLGLVLYAPSVHKDPLPLSAAAAAVSSLSRSLLFIP